MINSFFKKSQVISPLLLKNKQVILTITILALVADIFLLERNSDFIKFGILALYIPSTFFYNLRSKFTFLLCFFVLGSMFVGFLISGPSINTEKAAIWLFIFLAMGILQKLCENKK